MVRSLLSRVAAWIHGLWITVTRTIRRVITAVKHTVTVIITRHQQRAAVDGQYRAAIAAGVTAVVGTLTDRPGLAASIGVVLSERYRIPASSRPWVGHSPSERPGSGGWSGSPSRRPGNPAEWEDELEEEEWDPNAGPLWRGYR